MQQKQLYLKFSSQIKFQFIYDVCMKMHQESGRFNIWHASDLTEELMYLVRFWLKKNWYLLLIPIFLIIFAFVMKRRNYLSFYQPENGKEYTLSQESETESLISTKIYTSDRLPLSMEVPSDWTYVIKSGHDTFIDAASASSLQIQVLDYDPEVNNDDEDCLKEALSSKGCSLYSFTPISSSCYFLIYQKSTLDGVIDYFDYVTWDRQHIVKIEAVLNDKNYDRMYPSIEYMLRSLSWEKEEMIPEDLRIFYDEKNQFSFGYPLFWSNTITENGVFYAEDVSIGAYMSVFVDSSADSPSKMDEIAFSKMMADGRSDFTLAFYDQNEERIYAEGSYRTSDGIIYNMIELYASDGEKTVTIIFAFPNDQIDSLYSLCKDCIELYHIDESVEAGLLMAADGESFGENTNTVQTEDPFTIEVQALLQQESEEIVAAPESEAGSFSSALMMIAPFTYDQAQEIERIWDAVVSCRVIHVKGVCEDENIFTLAATTERGEKYYLSFEKDGFSLVSIKEYYADGTIIYRKP